MRRFQVRCGSSRTGRVDALIGTHFDLRVAECYDLEAIRDELGLDQSRFLVPAFLQ